MIPDVVGRPWREAEDLLQAAGIDYTTTVSRPTRDFFTVDEQAQYVVRQREAVDGTLQLVLCARLRKEVS